MPRPTALGVPCDVCGKDEYWDNRESKKNAKAPDWVCASRECPGKDGYKFGRWERDRAKWDKKAPQKPSPAPQEPAGAPKGGRLTPDDTTPDERGERVYTWEALTYTYSKLSAAVVKAMVEAGATNPDGTVDPNAVQAGVATLLIQGEKAHIPLLHPRKVTTKDVQKPAPKPAATGQSDNMDVDEEWEEVWP